MFVRTKKHKDIISFLVVENKRINGKPRQRVIKYLGSIKIKNKEYPYYQWMFWISVRDKLDSIDLSDQEKGIFEKNICKVVPFPVWKYKKDSNFNDLV